ncbi:hypothetical protein CKO13_01630 [Halorhodospira neutriphila]|uniref:HTH luxR-type domain-containing protein n=1 Tax=Halorhodospira neutriphila TaxID=168379 RepID=A0ABS1E5T6_9GAMM|nr:hypothetical protein [Halorhodospira neutriphila]
MKEEAVEAESAWAKEPSPRESAAANEGSRRSLPTVGIGGTDELGHSLLQELLAEDRLCTCRTVDVAAWLAGRIRERDYDLLLLDAAKVDEALQDLGRGVAPAGPGWGQEGAAPIALLNVGTDADVVPYMRLLKVVGIFRERTGPQLLRRGIEAMLRGEYWFPRDALHRYLAITRQELVAGTSAFHQLTGRERTVFTALANGWSNEEIAARLSVSLHTVKTHLYNLYRKLGVSSRAEAAILANQYRISRRCTGA